MKSLLEYLSVNFWLYLNNLFISISRNVITFTIPSVKYRYSKTVCFTLNFSYPWHVSCISFMYHVSCNMYHVSCIMYSAPCLTVSKLVLERRCQTGRITYFTGFKQHKRGYLGKAWKSLYTAERIGSHSIFYLQRMLEYF